jgi:alpha-ketoglutarate-dependent taurine dioxygenase
MKLEGKLDIPPTYHDLVYKSPYNHKDLLFLSSGHDGVSQIIDCDLNIKTTEIILDIIDHFGIYQHQWEEGDMIIWDNMQTMHRSAGDFEGPRLLFRL